MFFSGQEISYILVKQHYSSTPVEVWNFVVMATVTILKQPFRGCEPWIYRNTVSTWLVGLILFLKLGKIHLNWEGVLIKKFCHLMA